MYATVVLVTQNVTKISKANNEYTCTEFTYQGDPYQGKAKPPTTRNIFPDDEVHDLVMALEEGDRVNLVFNKDGQFTQLVGVSKISEAETPSTTNTSKPDTVVPTYVEPEYFKDDHPDKAKRIAQSVAVKAGVDMVLGFLASGAYKKSVTPEFLRNEILTSVQFLKRHLNVPTNLPPQTEEEAAPEEIPLPEEPPPVNVPDDDLPF